MRRTRKRVVLLWRRWKEKTMKLLFPAIGASRDQRLLEKMALSGLGIASWYVMITSVRLVTSTYFFNQLIFKHNSNRQSWWTAAYFLSYFPCLFTLFQLLVYIFMDTLISSWWLLDFANSEFDISVWSCWLKKLSLVSG